MISCKKSWIFYCCQCLVKMVIKRKAYCFDKFLNLGYILQMLLKKSFKLASSKVSVVFLHMFMIDFRASS